MYASYLYSLKSKCNVTFISNIHFKLYSLMFVSCYCNKKNVDYHHYYSTWRTHLKLVFLICVEGMPNGEEFQPKISDLAVHMLKRWFCRWPPIFLHWSIPIRFHTFRWREAWLHRIPCWWCHQSLFQEMAQTTKHIYYCITYI